MTYSIRSFVMCTATFGASLAFGASPFEIAGVYTETCACRPPCACELTGDVPGSCEGVGAVTFNSGSKYDGADLSGVKLAYAGKPGSWVRLYIEAPDEAHRAAAEKFGRAAFAPWGKMESVKTAKISVTGAGGLYTVSVNDGKTMAYVIKQVTGGDGKTAVVVANTHNPMTTSYSLAKSDKPTSYQDDDRKIDLEAGRNGYFNDAMKRSGSL